jgi:hypothetical protein
VGQVTVVAWPAQMSLALQLGEAADQSRTWPGLGTRDPGPIRLIVVPNEAEMQRLSEGRAPSWGAGMAMPSTHTIMLRADAGQVQDVLRHELAHLALRRVIRQPVPRWFDEGYAAYAAGEWGRMDAIGINLAVLRGAIPDLDQLNATLRGTEANASLGYALAMTAVMAVARHHPDHSLRPIITLLAEGQPFDSALRRSTGLTSGQFTVAWQKEIRRRYGVLGWFTLGGLWFLMAVAVLVAAYVRRRLDQPRRAALDVGWPAPPEEDETESELDQHGQSV